jgi:2-deoxy-D-gluconate 3-dehydrogenase
VAEAALLAKRPGYANLPAARWGQPGDLQGTVVFLASSASAYVNGHVLVVDGGWLAR